MPALTLIIIVVAAFMLLSALVLFIPGASKNKKNSVSLNLDKNTAVNITKDSDNSVIRIEYTSFEEIPTHVEVFDDYLPELPEQEGALNDDFWKEYIQFDSLPAKRKFELCELLVEHGLMDRKALDEFTFPIPVDETTGKPVIELPPDPEDTDGTEAFWKRKFEGEGE